METGYWAGQLFIKAPEDTVDVAIEHKHPYEGEIDVQLHIATPKEYSIDKLRDVVQTISFSVLSYFNVSAGELLIPVAPIQIRELGESNSTFQNSVTIRVKERRTFSAEFLQEAIERFVVTRCRMSGEEAAALDAAMRRYLDSITETDEIDKYCDFWETCEFATLGVNAKGGKVGRIAQALSDHMRKTNPTFSKRNIENRLRIKELYAARGAIVHNAIQNPSILKERSGLLSEVALELIRFRLDLPYKRNQVIEEAYQRVSTNQA